MAKITSSVTELPKSCKSVMENMERELRERTDPVNLQTLTGRQT